MSLAIASVGMFTVYGCGGGGSSTDIPTSTSAAPPASITVVPSLGQFSTGTPVAITKSSDASLISSGQIGTDGKVTLTLAGYTGPIVVEVQGAAGMTYFDELTQASQNFVTGKVLRALVPAAQLEVGVTALTHAAAEKLKQADGKFTNILAADINLANKKVGAIFDYADENAILAAPTLVNAGSAASTTKVDGATIGGAYALKLAALAKLATGGKTAIDVAEALALDLKNDDVVDGSTGTTAIAAPAYAATTLATDFVTHYKSAATDFADANSVTLANLTPPVVRPNVSTVVTTNNQSDVNLAKAMFAELRTTFKSFANDNKTAFLDTQSTRINADLNANVAPEVSKVAGRVAAIDKTISTFEDAMAYTAGTTHGFAPGPVPLSANTALVRSSGSLLATAYSNDSFNYCWTETTAATTATGTVTCAHATNNSAVWTHAGGGYIRMVVYALAGTSTPHQFSYTAARYNMAFTTFSLLSGSFTGVSQASGVPTGSGTVSKTVSGTTTTSLTLNGTLPPSATDALGTTYTSGEDTVAFTAVRTPLATANNYHYSLTGSVSTTKLQAVAAPVTSAAERTVTLSFDSGSYFDMDETNAATGNSKTVAAKLILSAKTAATQFTGTLDMSAFTVDVDGKNESPTNMTFNGSISDIRPAPNGTGEILTGTLATTMSNFSSYHSTQADTASNYIKGTVSFTGTVKAAWRPELKLVVAVNNTGFTTGNIAVNYSYGAVSLTGSGPIDTQNTSTNTLTLSNQNGIELIFSNTAATAGVATAGTSATVKKAGTLLATVGNGRINYVDGSYESLN